MQKKFANTENGSRKPTPATKNEKQTVSTLRGVKRMARSGVANWAGAKVRTRSGYKITARINDGTVSTLNSDGKWEEYPEEGRNLDPSWSPTPPQK